MSDAPVQDIHPSVWIGTGAQVYGEVSIAPGASLWPNVVIRAEVNEVRIGRYSNVQDFAMLHVGYDHPTHIGDYCSITHHAIIHGAVVEDACLIGINATLMDGAVIGAGSIVAGGAFVPEGKVFEAGSVIAGVPARVIATRDSARANRLNAWQYVRNAQAYRRGDHRSWTGPEYEAWLAEARARIATDADLREPLFSL